MLGEWGSWASNIVSNAATIATETVNEITQEFTANSNSNNSSINTKSAVRSLWDPLAAGASEFWSAHPMQWQCLVKGIARDLNTFVIAPEAAMAHSDTSKFVSTFVKMHPPSSSPSSSSSSSAAAAAAAAAASASASAEHTAAEGEANLPPSTDAIRKMLGEDAVLADLRHDLVPRWVNEDDFWAAFSWRCHILGRTISVEQAVAFVRLANTEHREIPRVAAASQKEDDAEQQLAGHKEEQQQQTPPAKQKISIGGLNSLLDQLIASPGIHSPRAPFAGRLSKRGFGAKCNGGGGGGGGGDGGGGDDGNDESERAWSELAESIRATGEKEAWQTNFSGRATRELDSVRSNVAMLSNLLSEVDEVLDDTGDASGTKPKPKPNPSLELLQSVAESCKYHKSRIAALIGELQSSPRERVAGTRFDPEVVAESENEDEDGDTPGALYLRLRNANEQLAAVLVRQVVALRTLGDHLKTQQLEAAVAKATTTSPQQQQQQPENSSPSPVEQEVSAKQSSSNSASPTTNTFMATMPWDDDE